LGKGLAGDHDFWLLAEGQQEVAFPSTQANLIPLVGKDPLQAGVESQVGKAENGACER
jgi:hypothetical protein